MDGKEYRYYYLDGKTDSPFISYQQESGSFKWTTKDAMLGIDKGGYREYGSVQLQDGTLTKMYQLDDGSVKFKNGSDWFGSNSPGEGATYGRVNGNFAGEDGFAGNLPKDGSMKLSQDPALARPSTGDIGTQPQPSSIGGQQGSFNNPGMPSGSGSFGGFTPKSAMQEFRQSPYGANSPSMHSSMNSFLNGLSPDGFNRFMVDAAETARANGYYPNGTLCVGCGMGHLYKQSRRNYQ